jgi:hypothetical protein
LGLGNLHRRFRCRLQYVLSGQLLPTKPYSRCLQCWFTGVTFSWAQMSQIIRESALHCEYKAGNFPILP